jgi:hypothetical protein
VGPLSGRSGQTVRAGTLLSEGVLSANAPRGRACTVDFGDPSPEVADGARTRPRATSFSGQSGRGLRGEQNPSPDHPRMSALWVEPLRAHRGAVARRPTSPCAWSARVGPAEPRRCVLAHHQGAAGPGVGRGLQATPPGRDRGISLRVACASYAREERPDLQNSG